jgi:hypothetical protein
VKRRLIFISGAAISICLTNLFGCKTSNRPGSAEKDVTVIEKQHENHFYGVGKSLEQPKYICWEKCPTHNSGDEKLGDPRSGCRLHGVADGAAWRKQDSMSEVEADFFATVNKPGNSVVDGTLYNATDKKRVTDHFNLDIAKNNNNPCQSQDSQIDSPNSTGLNLSETYSHLIKGINNYDSPITIYLIGMNSSGEWGKKFVYEAPANSPEFFFRYPAKYGNGNVFFAGVQFWAVDKNGETINSGIKVFTSEDGDAPYFIRFEGSQNGNSNSDTGCLVKGKNYPSGSNVPSDDCNNCSCSNGSVTCSEKGCPEPSNSGNHVNGSWIAIGFTKTPCRITTAGPGDKDTVARAAKDCNGRNTCEVRLKNSGCLAIATSRSGTGNCGYGLNFHDGDGESNRSIAIAHALNACRESNRNCKSEDVVCSP